jgi:hypothetical protein
MAGLRRLEVRQGPRTTSKVLLLEDLQLRML